MQRFPQGRRLRRKLDRTRGTDVPKGFDPVTGLALRVLFHQRAEEHWEQAAGSRSPFVLMLVDVDHFNEYCTTLGSSAGDECLKAISEVLAAHCKRREDLVGRVRDHEFAVMLSETGHDGAVRMAAQICAQVEALQFKSESSGGVVTVSIGVASMVPRPVRFVESMLITADQCLKKARADGGNRVIDQRE